MRPNNLSTKIFIDGGDPRETREIINNLGFLDGQTTNPTLISKHPQAQARLAQGLKFSKDEILGFYKEIVQEIAQIIPQGSVSIEVYSDQFTMAQDMLTQGREMFSWVSNAHIKFPTTAAGLQAANLAIKEGLRVNMTLCFTQAQAAAVYAATRGAKTGQVFVSPFVGRLDDRMENGMELIKNILQMYHNGDGHVEVLTASVRNLNHFMYALELQSDIITAPAKVLREWADQGLPIPSTNEYAYNAGSLKSILYKNLNLNKEWNTFDINHDLTDKGIERFSKDWNALLKL